MTQSEEWAEKVHEEMEALLASGLFGEALERIPEIDRLLRGRRLSRESRIWLLNVAARAEMEAGRPSARSRLQRALRLARQLDIRTLEGVTLLNVGAEASFSHKPKVAAKAWIESLRIFGDTGDYGRYSQALMNLLGVLIKHRQFDTAENVISELLPMLRGARDPWGRFGVYLALGHLRAEQGQPTTAAEAFRLALAAAKRTGEDTRIAAALQNLGSAYLDQGKVKRAASNYRRALDLAGADSPTRFKAELLRGLALAQFRQGERLAAESSLREVREIARLVGDPAILADADSDLAAIRIAERQWAAARHYLDQALTLRRALGDRRDVAQSLNNLAVLEEKLTRYESAAKLLESAASALGDDADAAELLETAGDMWLKDNKAERAAETFSSAVEAALAKDRRRSAWTSLMSAAKLAAADAPDSALPFFARSIQLYTSLQDSQMTFHSLNDRALCRVDAGDLGGAASDLRQARRLGLRANDRVMLAQSELNLGEVMRRQGRPRAAVTSLRRAASVAESIDDASLRAEALGNLGLTLIDLGEIQDAESVLRTALEIARNRDDNASESLARGGLGAVAMSRGDMESSASHYRAAARAEARLGAVRHQTESLGGLVEAMAALNPPKRQFNRELQRLIDISQAARAEDVAVGAALRSARWFLHRGDTKAGAALLAGAMTLSGTTLERDPEGEHFARTLVEAAFYWIIHISGDVSDFRSAIAGDLRRIQPGLDRAFAPWVRSAFESASSIPVKSSRREWASRTAKVESWQRSRH